MSRFQATFERCRGEGRAALMPYMTAGDPDLVWTERLIDEVVARGADMVELGMPYSDPLADGPTVQAAGRRALEAGTTIHGVFDLVRRVRTRHNLPIALLIYYNCIFRTGEEAFVNKAADCGIDGLIIPDLPPEEGESLQRTALARGVNLIYLVAPTSTPARIGAIARQADGFIYCVSLTGVTGARKNLSDQLESFLSRVRTGLRAEGKDLPLAVGFGISTPEQVAHVSAHAEGVIVGSALIDRLYNAESPAAGVQACGELIGNMRKATGSDRPKAQRHTIGQ